MAALVPKVGVGVMIVKDGCVLLGRRKGSHGEGEWAFPGGHLEHMESFEECAARECLEECGVEIANIRLMQVGNVRAYAPKHYVHIGVAADWKAGEPRNLEPDKCDGWEWFPLDRLPDTAFSLSRHALEQHRSGDAFRYFNDPE